MSASADTVRVRVDPAALRGELEKIVRQHFGVRARIAQLERRPSAYHSSFVIEELDVRLHGGQQLQLLFKNLSREAVLPGARAAKPSFLHDPQREIETYRHILAPHGLSAPACYGAVMDPGSGRYWLFLEKVAGIELYQEGDFANWQQAARWLARMHQAFLGRVQELSGKARLIVSDREFFRLWPQRALETQCAARLHGRDADLRALERLAGRYELVVNCLAGQPVTFLHGEFYASNILVQQRAAGLRVCPVDWEMAAVGPGLLDLAALTAGRWTEAERTALALAYHSEGARRANQDRDDFLRLLDCCRLHGCMQWLGWSATWSPPAEHRQDWLGEAIHLSAKLGL